MSIRDAGDPPTATTRSVRAEPGSGRRLPASARWTLIAIAVACGLVLLYSLPVLDIPLINTPQVSFASVLFYPIGIYVLLAVGLDMTVGRSGQVNLGYAAFFAGGAYTTALLSTHLHWSYYATIVPAIVVGMILGLIVGVVSLRVGGDYFAIVTLGIGLVVQEIVANVGIFGTTVGISSIPPPTPLGGLTFSVSNLKAYDWLLFTMIIVVCVIFAVLYRSPIGRAWSAIREDEGAAQLMGVKVRKLKVLASMIGAAPGGLAGSIYAAEVGYISPETFGLTLSILVLAAVALGGKGRIVGVVVGGIIVGYLPERFLAVDKFDTLLFGIVLVLVMLFRPEGILGSFGRGRRRTATRASDVKARAAGLLGGATARRAGVSGDGAPSAAGAGGSGGIQPPQPADGVPALAVAAAAGESEYAAAGRAAPDADVGGARPGAAGSPGALTVEHARVAFGGVVALDDVSLTVVPGAVTSVIGPNGAGKTTLINAITGVYRLSSGRIRLGEHDVTGASIIGRAWMGLGRTFQNIRLFGGMTALENVLVAAEARRRGKIPGNGSADTEPRGRSQITDEALALLEEVGLADAADTRSDRLPYGAQRRLEMARALALQPKVLLLDEPAAGANTTEKRELTDLIGAIAAGGRSVLLIEHDMRLVMEISTKIVVLNFGKVIADGTPTEIRNDPAVIAAYLGETDNA